MQTLTGDTSINRLQLLIKAQQDKSDILNSQSKTCKKMKSAKDKKVEKVMHEFKEGTLHSGKSKKKVTDRKQAIAIAMSESGQAKKATDVLSNLLKARHPTEETAINNTALEESEICKQSVQKAIEFPQKIMEDWQVPLLNIDLR